MRQRHFKLSNGEIIHTPLYMHNQDGYLYNDKDDLIEGLMGDFTTVENHYHFLPGQKIELVIETYTDGLCLNAEYLGGMFTMPFMKDRRKVIFEHNTTIVEEIDPPLVYVAGPMTGLDEEEYSNHFVNACIHLIKNRGFKAYNSSVNKTIKEDLSYNQLLVYDIAELSKCDAIYMLKGWDKSKGAKAELHCAQAFDLNILYE